MVLALMLLDHVLFRECFREFTTSPSAFLAAVRCDRRRRSIYTMISSLPIVRLNFVFTLYPLSLLHAKHLLHPKPHKQILSCLFCPRTQHADTQGRDFSYAANRPHTSLDNDPSGLCFGYSPSFDFSHAGREDWKQHPKKRRRGCGRKKNRNEMWNCNKMDPYPRQKMQSKEPGLKWRRQWHNEPSLLGVIENSGISE